MKPTLRKIIPNPLTSLSIRKDTGKDLLSNWHYHPELELVYIQNGAGIRTVGDNMDNLQQRDMLLIGPDLPHSFNHDIRYLGRTGKQAPEAIVIHFRKEFLGIGFWSLPEMAQIGKLLDLARQGLRIEGKTQKKVASLMSKIFNASPAMRIILLLRILDEIATSPDYQPLASKSFNYSKNPLEDGKLSKIYQYTFENFGRKINVPEIAAIIRLSPPAFCRYFKQKTRKTYLQFLVEIRIGHACRLLLENEMSVSEICYSCGYNNISHFNHQFRHVMHKSPGQYRNEHAANQNHLSND